MGTRSRIMKSENLSEPRSELVPDHSRKTWVQNWVQSWVQQKDLFWPKLVRKLRQINESLNGYEPEGREFESLRARQTYPINTRLPAVLSIERMVAW